MNEEGIFNKYKFEYYRLGHPLQTPIHYPRFFLLKNLLNLGIPDCYLFQDFKSPMIAVYPNAIYATAPEYENDD